MENPTKNPQKGFVDKELESKCKHLSENVSESLHIVCHDPSLALYRLQEHVRKSMPAMVDKKAEVMQLQNGLQGGCFDLENAIEAVESMNSSLGVLNKVYELLRSSMYYKQQLDYERLRNEDRRTAAMHRLDSCDSLAAEVRRTKSLGHIRPSPSATLSESLCSRSTASTPVSEYQAATGIASPATNFSSDDALERLDSNMRLAMEKAVELNEPSSTRSSTPTSGADSPNPSDFEEGHIPYVPSHSRYTAR